MIEIQHYFVGLIREVAQLDSQMILLALLIMFAAIVLDAVATKIRKTSKQVGVTPKVKAVSVDGSKTLPVRNYVSEMQGLAGRPDAIIVEHGDIIPVERKPLARKIHDRYVAQVLVYMRLIEEFEGRRPPYGYLILGPNCRKVRIDNSPERQAWLQNIIDEMRSVLHREKVAKAAPHPKKCRKCDVRDSCETHISGIAHEHQSQKRDLVSISAKSRRTSQSQ